MGKIISVVFFAAWLMCGCSVEKICDDWRAALIFVVAFAVTLMAAVVIGDGYDDEK